MRKKMRRKKNEKELEVVTQRMLRLIGWVAVAAVAILSLMPGQDRPHVFETSQLEHLGAYFAAGVLLAFGYAQRHSQVVIGIWLSALAAALEMGQQWVQGRHPRMIDWGAGTLGAWTGIALVLMVLWIQARLRTGAARTRAR
jgi:hypothetical protein